MDNRLLYLGGALVVLLLVGVATLNQDSTPGNTNATWTGVELTDVRTGENFTVDGLDKPVLVENFAVWCPTCTRQQKEVRALKQQGVQFTSVSLDTDPNEDAEKIRAHVQRHGFDWRYAVAPPEVTRGLSDQYGSSILNPPSAPMILVCEDGTRKLPFGVKSASNLQDQIERGC